MEEQTDRSNKQTWDWEISPETSWLGVKSKEIFAYKDLLFSLARKEFIAYYQQTLLGPLWVLLQPILTVITYVFVFNTLIGVSTEGVPPILFNLIGITLWNLFSEVFLNTAKTFSQNAQVFNKIYFPRIIVALSSLWLQLLLFGIQFLLLIVIALFYLLTGKSHVNLTHIYLIIPAIIITSGIGLGLGLVFSVLTAKYRDLLAFIQLMIRLLMFVCPVFYSLNMVPEKIKWAVNLNPLAPQFELFRLAFINKGSASISEILYSVIFMIAIVFFGGLLFNKMSDRLMDII